MVRSPSPFNLFSDRDGWSTTGMGDNGGVYVGFGIGSRRFMLVAFMVEVKAFDMALVAKDLCIFLDFIYINY